MLYSIYRFDIHSIFDSNVVSSISFSLCPQVTVITSRQAFILTPTQAATYNAITSATPSSDRVCLWYLLAGRPRASLLQQMHLIQKDLIQEVKFWLDMRSCAPTTARQVEKKYVNLTKILRQKLITLLDIVYSMSIYSTLRIYILDMDNK